LLDSLLQEADVTAGMVACTVLYSIVQYCASVQYSTVACN